MGKAKIEVVDSKSFMKSKTIWLNFISIAVIALQVLTQTNYFIDPELQALLLALLNVLVRFQTDGKIEFRKKFL